MNSGSGVMAGKRGLIMGVANDRSIAWGIAQSLSSQGAELAFTYQGEAFKKRVIPLVEPLRPAALIDCDVTQPASARRRLCRARLRSGASSTSSSTPSPSPTRSSSRGATSTRRADNFAMTMNISCYSFTAVAQRAEKLMPNGGSLLTLTYYGAEKVMPHYNVMGVAKAALEASVRYLAEDLGKKDIRVNAISAGPIKTLAASGIGDFRYILKWNELNSPLRRNVTTTEVGDAALFLLSDLARGITGEMLHVDAGYHIVGMKAEDAPDIAVVNSKIQRRLSAAMSHNSFGHLFRVTTLGESHGPAIGCVVDGCPPGIPLDRSGHPALARSPQARPIEIRHAAARARPGAHPLRRVRGRAWRSRSRPERRSRSSSRTWMQRSKDYSDIRDKFRPGHADYTYWAKYGLRDYRGGGRQSARETATRVAAGAIARKILDRMYGTVTIRGGADPDGHADDRPRALGLGRGRAQPVLMRPIPASSISGRTISTACASRARPAARPSRWSLRACRSASARRSTASSTPTSPPP